MCDACCQFPLMQVFRKVSALLLSHAIKCWCSMFARPEFVITVSADVLAHNKILSLFNYYISHCFFHNFPYLSSKVNPNSVIKWKWNLYNIHIGTVKITVNYFPSSLLSVPDTGTFHFIIIPIWWKICFALIDILAIMSLQFLHMPHNI